MLYYLEYLSSSLLVAVYASYNTKANILLIHYKTICNILLAFSHNKLTSFKDIFLVLIRYAIPSFNVFRYSSKLGE